MTSRFRIEAPNPVGAAWNILRHGDAFMQHSLTWVEDLERHERFALTEEEIAMLEFMTLNMDRVADAARIPPKRWKKFWTPERVATVKDRVLSAISERHKGDTADWDRLRAMSAAEWKAWLDDIAKT